MGLARTATAIAALLVFTAADPLTLPRVASLAALQALPVTQYPSGVLLVGRTVAGDIPPVAYVPLKSGGVNVACPLSSGNGDGGGQIKSSDSKCWTIQPPAIIDARWWPTDPTGTTDSSAGLQAAMTWVGANRPGSVLTCGGSSPNNGSLHYKIGTGFGAGTNIFQLSNALRLRGCRFDMTDTTTTTNIFRVLPTSSDYEGWGFQDIEIVAPIGTEHWQDTFDFTDGGNNALLIRHLQFDNVTVGQSSNRTGDDFNIAATGGEGSQGLIITSTLGPNVTFFRGVKAVNLGDSISFNGFTVSGNSYAMNLSNDPTGAGETAITDPNFTASGGLVLSGMYGTHIRGGVMECLGTALTAANNSFINVSGSSFLDIDGLQVQGGACATPPKVLTATTTGAIDATFIAGGNLAGSDLTGRYSVDASSTPSASISEVGGAYNTFASTFGANCPSGTIGTGNSVTLHYHWIPHTTDIAVHGSVTMGASGNGTCAGSGGYISFTLPFTANDADFQFYGREVANTGKSLTIGGSGGTSLAAIRFYDNSYPGANGSIFDFRGTYKAQR